MIGMIKTPEPELRQLVAQLAGAPKLHATQLRVPLQVMEWYGTTARKMGISRNKLIWAALIRHMISEISGGEYTAVTDPMAELHRVATLAAHDREEGN